MSDEIKNTETIENEDTSAEDVENTSTGDDKEVDDVAAAESNFMKSLEEEENELSDEAKDESPTGEESDKSQSGENSDSESAIVATFDKVEYTEEQVVERFKGALLKDEYDGKVQELEKTEEARIEVHKKNSEAFDSLAPQFKLRSLLIGKSVEDIEDFIGKKGVELVEQLKNLDPEKFPHAKDAENERLTERNNLLEGVVLADEQTKALKKAHPSLTDEQITEIEDYFVKQTNKGLSPHNMENAFHQMKGQGLLEIKAESESRLKLHGKSQPHMPDAKTNSSVASENKKPKEGTAEFYEEKVMRSIQDGGFY